ncbi:MAG TPA: hypothetical protein VF135_07795 [Terriglobales bacterium]
MLLLFAFSGALAQNRHRATENDYSVAVTFNEGRGFSTPDGDASLDIGEVSQAASVPGGRGGLSKPSYTILRQFRVQITRRGGGRGQVSLSAYLQRECLNCKLRLDGIELSSAPRVILADVPLNAITNHRLEIEISKQAPPGALDAAIEWEVSGK